MAGDESGRLRTYADVEGFRAPPQKGRWRSRLGKQPQGSKFEFGGHFLGIIISASFWDFTSFKQGGVDGKIQANLRAP